MRRRCCGPPRLPQPTLAQPASAQPSLALEAPRPRPAPVAAPPSPAGEGAAAPRRHLALVFPELPLDRLRRAGACPAEPGAPLVVWGARGARRLLLAVDSAGRAAGLRPGQPLADAQAIAPGLLAIEEDPEADLHFLRRLALWALRFTPLAATDAPDGLLLDVTGAAHLFGGEAALLRATLAALARAGIADPRGAIASPPAAAAALARAGRGAIPPPGGGVIPPPGGGVIPPSGGGVIVPPGEEAAALDPLPLAALRLPGDLAVTLHRLGLRRLGELRRQPRAPLARRFGTALTDLLDAALGLRPQPITPIRPPPDLTAARDCLEPVATREAIDASIAALLATLCRRLDRAGRGLRRLTLLAHRVDGGVQEIALGLGLPSRDPAHLNRLLAEKLDRLEPGLGFERLALLAERCEPLSPRQDGLAGTGGTAGGAATQPEALAQLLDRLSQRLPVWRWAPRASHWPERAVTRADPFAEIEVPDGWPHRPRPLRLLRRPVEIAAVALLPDAPPSLLRISGRSHRVARAEGPERLAAEWWHRAEPDAPAERFRDYYRVELASGARLWVCRVGFGARWYLHGIGA